MYLDANLIEGAALNYVIVSDYDDEVQQRWGNTEQFRESTQ